MRGEDGDFDLVPGRMRDRGRAGTPRLAARVRRAARGSGRAGARSGSPRGTGVMGRGRGALAAMRQRPQDRRVAVVARIVRHRGARYSAAPLALHIDYLERDGVTRDGAEAAMFGGEGNEPDRTAFAERCEDDRHHFRFIVSPEDAAELGDLRAFTRDLAATMERDLGTRLDWIAVDHWDTANPHVHLLVRGVTDRGEDLVIDRGYVSRGIRARAGHLATLELGPRTERDIDRAMAREVGAERWTSLDRTLRGMAEANGGLVDLRPDPGGPAFGHGHLVARAEQLGRMGLAERQAPGVWSLDAQAETTLRDLGERGDVIAAIHRACARAGRTCEPASLSLHNGTTESSVVGRLLDRGLHDELAGTAYAVIAGADGRTHHVRLADLALAGDAAPGAIVETRSWTDRRGTDRLALAVRSDLPLEAQVDARGATWLDRQLVARAPVATGSGFGREIRAAMEARLEHLAGEGLAKARAGALVPVPGLVATLRARDLAAACDEISRRTGLAAQPLAEGQAVAGIYRERVALASGRFAMIEDGLGFRLVPWRPVLEGQLGRRITGMPGAGGTIDWHIGRGRGIGR